MLTAATLSPPPPPPDQQYWQWPEAKLAPWPVLREALFSRGRARAWQDKEPRVLWRGSASQNPVRGVGGVLARSPTC